MSIEAEADSPPRVLETDAGVARGIVAPGELPARASGRPEGVHGSVIPEFTGSPGSQSETVKMFISISPEKNTREALWVSSGNREVDHSAKISKTGGIHEATRSGNSQVMGFNPKPAQVLPLAARADFHPVARGAREGVDHRRPLAGATGCQQDRAEGRGDLDR